MSVAAIWGAIVTGIRYLPEIIAFIKEIETLVQSAETLYEKRQKLAQITQAASLAAKTGDTSALEQIFSGAQPQPAPTSKP